MSDKEYSSFYYVIPAEIMHAKDLDIYEKHLYALISGLASKHGYCFAGNEWFETELGIGEKKIQRHLSALETRGYITRQMVPYVNNPFKKQRRIFINAIFKKFLRGVSPDAPWAVSPDALGASPQTGIISESNTLISEERHKEREGALPPPPTPQASGDPPLFDAFKNIILKKEEFEKLVSEFGEPTVMEKIEALNDYRDIKPKEFKKYGKHALVIRNWIKKDLIKNKLESNTNGASLNEAQKENLRLNQELVNELKVDYPDRAATMTIFYKYHVLKSKIPEFDISMLIGHKEFCRFLEKHLRMNILEVRFPNG